VCGERRYRAAKLAKLETVPCVVKPNLDDKAILELSITENLQREDLTPIDEAKAIKALMQKCGYSQAQVGVKLGLSVAAINYKLSLLDLSPDLQKDIRKGALSETQGRTIVQAVRKDTNLNDFTLIDAYDDIVQELDRPEAIADLLDTHESRRALPKGLYIPFTLLS